MPLKALLETLDGVDDSHKAFYKEDNGKFLLDIEGVDEHPTVKHLKTSFEKTKAEKKTANDQLAALRTRFDGIPDDFDVDAYNSMKALTEGKKPDEVRAEIRTQLEDKHRKDLDKVVKEKETIEASLRKLLIDDGITKALLDANVGKEFMAAAKALIKEKGVIKIETDDGVYTAIVETDLGNMPISKYVGEWVAGDEGKVFVPKATGGSATGGEGKTKSSDVNPWKKETRNLTQQGAIIRDDKVKAARMMKDAGLPQADIDRALQSQ